MIVKFIYISENSYQEFIESITEESDEVLKKFKEMYPSIASFSTTHNRIERCIQIQEKWLLDLLQFKSVDMWKIISDLRNRSVSKKYYKINPESENILYEAWKDVDG